MWLNFAKSVEFRYLHSKKKKKIWEFIHILNYHDVHFKYFTVMFTMLQKSWGKKKKKATIKERHTEGRVVDCGTNFVLNLHRPNDKLISFKFCSFISSISVSQSICYIYMLFLRLCFIFSNINVGKSLYFYCKTFFFLSESFYLCFQVFFLIFLNFFLILFLNFT